MKRDRSENRGQSTMMGHLSHHDDTLNRSENTGLTHSFSRN